jgi:hypothetical protein
MSRPDEGDLDHYFPQGRYPPVTMGVQRGSEDGLFIPKI